jgi:hypothetical protein
VQLEKEVEGDWKELTSWTTRKPSWNKEDCSLGKKILGGVQVAD